MVRSNELKYVDNVYRNDKGEFEHEVFGVVIVQGEHVTYTDLNDSQKCKEEAKRLLKAKLQSLIDDIDKGGEEVESYLDKVTSALASLNPVKRDYA